MYVFAIFSSTLLRKQAVAEGNTLFQLRKSFRKDTTVGFAEYLFQLDRDKEIAPAEAPVTTATQSNLQK